MREVISIGDLAAVYAGGHGMSGPYGTGHGMSGHHQGEGLTLDDDDISGIADTLTTLYDAATGAGSNPNTPSPGGARAMVDSAVNAQAQNAASIAKRGVEDVKYQAAKSIADEGAKTRAAVMAQVKGYAKTAAIVAVLGVGVYFGFKALKKHGHVR